MREGGRGGCRTATPINLTKPRPTCICCRWLLSIYYCIYWLAPEAKLSWQVGIFGRTFIMPPVCLRVQRITLKINPNDRNHIWTFGQKFRPQRITIHQCYSGDSVSGRRIFAVLHWNCSWWVSYHYCAPATGQPTRPTQPFALSGSINE